MPLCVQSRCLRVMTCVAHPTFCTQSFDSLKLLAVLITISGATFVALSDSSSGPEHTFYGDALALLGAILYGAYVSLLSTRIMDEESFPMPMFFGFVGVRPMCLSCDCQAPVDLGKSDLQLCLGRGGGGVNCPRPVICHYEVWRRKELWGS